jgi:hypothetical protein
MRDYLEALMRAGTRLEFGATAGRLMQRFRLWVWTIVNSEEIAMGERSSSDATDGRNRRSHNDPSHLLDEVLKWLAKRHPEHAQKQHPEHAQKQHPEHAQKQHPEHAQKHHPEHTQEHHPEHTQKHHADPAREHHPEFPPKHHIENPPRPSSAEDTPKPRPEPPSSPPAPEAPRSAGNDRDKPKTNEEVQREAQKRLIKESADGAWTDDSKKTWKTVFDNIANKPGITADKAFEDLDRKCDAFNKELEQKGSQYKVVIWHRVDPDKKETTFRLILAGPGSNLFRDADAIAADNDTNRVIKVGTIKNN